MESLPTPAWIVILDAVDGSATRVQADAAAADYIAQGADARLLRSGEGRAFDSSPDLWIIYIGPFDDRDSAAEACSELFVVVPECSARLVE